MLIGELAGRAGTSARTLRYYEQHGLVRARRSSSGYRVYDEAEVSIVRKIRALLELGFDLAVRHLPARRQSQRRRMPDSVETLRRKLAARRRVLRRRAAHRAGTRRADGAGPQDRRGLRTRSRRPGVHAPGR
ncbi:MerR family transcriptional regulator [Nocardia wallacei]|uniref:MerR family transcriptional regulator n=1 Tax=Nocardia wallacei TaxID=480035 RepID=UPI0024580F38|nr:MerR family transcriptional regulator [Nocardia wallacei]